MCLQMAWTSLTDAFDPVVNARVAAISSWWMWSWCAALYSPCKTNAERLRMIAASAQ
jgi:hypothetical protein